MMIAPITESGIENRDDDRGAPASEEQQDHDAGQERRDHTLERDTLDGAADEQRLIADETDLERIRELVADVDHLLLDAGDDIQRQKVAPAFSTIISTERLPSTWTILVCGGLPSRT